MIRPRRYAVRAAGLVVLSLAALTQAAPMKFSFSEHAADGFSHVAPGTAYDPAAGFGFEGDSTSLFSVKYPAEGNYRVTVTFGGKAATALTVKAESRRLMVEDAKAAAGETKTVTFLVNVRGREIAGGGAVRTNDREAKTYTWDDKLTLEFLPDASAVRTLEIAPAADDVTTVYLAGDSTVTDQADEPWAGWGQMFPRFFGPDVAVSSHAESGRALRSFRAERRLDKILSSLKAGDYVFIQFGHNDMKEKGDGVGALTTYKADLQQYVAAVRAKQATPVLVTPMYRRRFDSDGKLQDTLGDYPLANRQVAEEQKVTLIDLHEMSGTFFQTLGTEPSKRAFVHYPANTFPGQTAAFKDDTHFNNYGAYQLARCVVEGIRTSDLPLAKRLAEDVKPFDPSKPDDVDAFSLSASVARPTTRPEGS